MNWNAAVNDILRVGSIALSAINPLAGAIVSAVERIWPDGNGETKAAISRDVVTRVIDVLRNANIISASTADILTVRAPEYVEMIFQQLTEDGSINGGKPKEFTSEVPGAFTSPRSVAYNKPARVLIEY